MIREGAALWLRRELSLAWAEKFSSVNRSLAEDSALWLSRKYTFGQVESWGGVIFWINERSNFRIEFNEQRPLFSHQLTLTSVYIFSIAWGANNKNLSNNQEQLRLVIISFILVSFLFDSEIRWKSLLGVEGFNLALFFVWSSSQTSLLLTKDRKSFKRGCQHPSNKFEILWQVTQYSFSLLLSYFVAQYVLIIVV